MIDLTVTNNSPGVVFGENSGYDFQNKSSYLDYQLQLLSFSDNYLIKLHFNRMIEYGVTHSKRAIAAKFALKLLKNSRIIYPVVFDKAWLIQNQNNQSDF